MKSRRAPRRAADMRQGAFVLETLATCQEAEPSVPVSDRMFVRGDRQKLCIGSEPLEAYLRRTGQTFVLRLASWLSGLDLTSIKQQYSTVGRHAIHPEIMLGLILYGVTMGQASLRALQRLATCDVGAWWICRGEQPDHSTIGKFIVKHADALSGDVFASLVRTMARELRLAPNDSAIDGTVIESAASRYNMLKAEAAKQAADEATRAAADEPSDARAQRDAARAEQLAELVAQRKEARAEKGRPADFVRGAVTDPEAVNQPRKDGVLRPAYKPSVLANEGRLILGTHVEPSSENAAVEPLLQQHDALFGAPPAALLADAGYHSAAVIMLVAKQEIDFLCPSGKASHGDNFERESCGTAKFGKHLFVYQPQHDCYRCPGGQSLLPIENSVDRDGRRLTKYGGADCSICEHAKKCTTSANGRTIKRYDGDEEKEALAQVMKHPAARARYRRRSTIVEPVFAGLRALGLSRFRRRGLRRVRAEFAIFCMAYNLRRAEGIRAARAAAFVVIWIRPNGLLVVTIAASVIA